MVRWLLFGTGAAFTILGVIFLVVDAIITDALSLAGAPCGAGGGGSGCTSGWSEGLFLLPGIGLLSIGVLLTGIGLLWILRDPSARR